MTSRTISPLSRLAILATLTALLSACHKSPSEPDERTYDEARARAAARPAVVHAARSARP